MNSDLAHLVRVHDDDPSGTRAALAAMAKAGVSTQDCARYSWLLNHVIGEKFGAWGEAFELHQAACMSSEEPAVLRNVAVAAWLAGRAEDALRAEEKLGRLHDVPSLQAMLACRLGQVMYLSTALPREDFARSLLQCLNALESIEPAPVLTPMFAACLNNCVSALLDRLDESTVTDEAVSSALMSGAIKCRELWFACGTWENRERAHYLVALCCNRLGKWASAIEAAREALSIIEANGEEDIDEAFLLLELARAFRGAGQSAEANEALERARTVAERVDEPEYKASLIAKIAAM